jgi:hypothetical protein
MANTDDAGQRRRFGRSRRNRRWHILRGNFAAIGRNDDDVGIGYCGAAPGTQMRPAGAANDWFS